MLNNYQIYEKTQKLKLNGNYRKYRKNNKKNKLI